MTSIVCKPCGDRWFDPGLLLGLMLAVLVPGGPLPFWKVESVSDTWPEWCHPMMKAERDVRREAQ